VVDQMIPNAARSGARVAWSLRVRRIGGLIQVAFAAYWLVRGSLAIGGPVGTVLAAAVQSFEQGGPTRRQDEDEVRVGKAFTDL